MDEIKKLYDKTRDLLKKWGVTDPGTPKHSQRRTSNGYSDE